MNLPAICRNRKNGKRYSAFNLVINCTNAQDGQKMVLYQDCSDPTAGPFVRELQEFLAKFDIVEEADAGGARQ